jgi:L-alanine-DL-glutamate epimerase-like enolase superfamily enzyme
MAPHLWGGAVLFASGLHLAVATPCVTTLEFSRGDNPLLHDLLEEPFELVDGFIIPSDRPGLGITLRGDFVRSITVPV